MRNVGITAAAVLTGGRRLFTVDKTASFVDVDHFLVSSGHVNEHLLRKRAGQHGITLAGVLRPGVGCLEAKVERDVVPRRTTLRAGMPVETVHTDLAGPYEASMGGSHYLIMFVDNA